MQGLVAYLLLSPSLYCIIMSACPPHFVLLVGYKLGLRDISAVYAKRSELFICLLWSKDADVNYF